MSRRQPTAEQLARAIVAASRCPDCKSIVGLINEVGPDTFIAEVLHDDSCAWLAADERRVG